MSSPPLSKPSLFSGTPDIPRSLCSNHVFPLSMTLSHSTWTRALSSSQTRPQPSFLSLLCWERVQAVATTASYGWFLGGISRLVTSLTFTPDISAVGGVQLPSPPESQAPHLTPQVPHLGLPPPATLSIQSFALRHALDVSSLSPSHPMGSPTDSGGHLFEISLRSVLRLGPL